MKLSERAVENLQGLSDNPEVYEAVLDALQLIEHEVIRAQQMSSAFVSGNATIVLCLPVVGFPPLKVFWSSGQLREPRVEAIFVFGYET